MTNEYLYQLGNALQQGIAQAAAVFKRLKEELPIFLQPKETCVMWSSTIMDYPAHWRLIAHNPRNNRRTKRKK